MPPQPPRGGPRQRMLPTPRGVNMIVWSLDNRFVLAAIMGNLLVVFTLILLMFGDVLLTLS
jgi:PH-interacting protein